MSKKQGNGKVPSTPSTQPPPPDTPEEAVRELRVLFGELKVALARSNELTAQCINGLSLVELALMGGEAKGIAHDAQIADIAGRLAALERLEAARSTLPSAEPVPEPAE